MTWYYFAGPHKYSRQFSAPLGTTQQPKKEISSKQLPDVNSESPDANSESKNSKKYKKDSKSKLSEKEINNFIDSLMPTRPFVEPFQFRKRTGETDAAFMRRVNQETDRALNQAKIDEKYQVHIHLTNYLLNFPLIFLFCGLNSTFSVLLCGVVFRVLVC